MSNQLLPCPFCGGDAGENQHTDDCYFTARQAVIDAERGDVSGVPEMIKAWNRRAAQPAAGESATVDDLARRLFAAFAKAEPESSITLNPTSYWATFVEMARAVLQSAPPAAAPVAAGKPVAEFISHPKGKQLIFLVNGEVELPVGTKLYKAAPPAAAHGDEAVRKDAERYRWLVGTIHQSGAYKCLYFDTYLASLDEAIDAAMRAQAGEGGEV